MNEPKDNSPALEADRVIARYGVPPPETMRQALHETLSKERELFRAFTRQQDQWQHRLHERGYRER